MQRVAEFIRSTLSLRAFVPLLVLALATTWFGLFWSVDHFATLTGGLHFMDLQPRLNAQELFAQIRSYSAAATDFYRWWLLFDCAWPLLTFTTMLYVGAWLVGFLPPRARRRFPLLVGSAYLTVLMDWAENGGFALLLLGLPDERMWLAHVTLALHAAKLFFNAMFNIGFAILLVAAVVAGLRARADQA